VEYSIHGNGTRCNMLNGPLGMAQYRRNRTRRFFKKFFTGSLYYVKANVIGL